MTEKNAIQINDSNDVIIFETKVISAMNRLRCSSNSAEGIDSSSIVNYLSKKDSSLDGDIESQVITALQTGIGKGYICGLRNGNYSLVGTRPSKMIANCYNSASHGPNCICNWFMSGKRRCCSFRVTHQMEFVKNPHRNTRKMQKMMGKGSRKKGKKPRTPYKSLSCGRNRKSNASAVSLLSCLNASDTCLKCGRRKVISPIEKSMVVDYDLRFPREMSIQNKRKR